MDNYNILLNEIKEYLNRDEVNSENANNEIISLFDLYNIINGEFEGLRNITINSKINKKLSLPTKINIFSNKQLTSYIHGNEKNCRINFKKIKYFGDGDCSLKIYKDKGVNDIYFDREKSHHNREFYNFIKRNYNLILETLQTLEDYVELLGKFNSNSIDFSDDLFKVKLSFNLDGEVNYSVSIRSDHCLAEEYSKKWYQRENICDFANKHKEEILKRIPISPYELKEPFKKIYYNHKEKNNTDVKVKSLRISK